VGSTLLTGCSPSEPVVSAEAAATAEVAADATPTEAPTEVPAAAEPARQDEEAESAVPFPPARNIVEWEFDLEQSARDLVDEALNDPVAVGLLSPTEVGAELGGEWQGGSAVPRSDEIVEIAEPACDMSEEPRAIDSHGIDVTYYDQSDRGLGVHLRRGSEVGAYFDLIAALGRCEQTLVLEESDLGEFAPGARRLVATRSAEQGRSPGDLRVVDVYVLHQDVFATVSFESPTEFDLPDMTERLTRMVTTMITRIVD